MTHMHFRGLAAAIALAVAPAAPATNYVHLIAFRVDDPYYPSAAFDVEMTVTLEDVPGVTGVTMSIDGSPPEPLEQYSSGDWGINGQFETLAQMITEVSGEYELTITGASPSVSTFTFDASLFANGDFYATPDGLYPPNGAIGVPPGVVLSWNDPTGPATPDGIFAYVGNELLQQEVSSYAGTLDITDTSWDPDQNLAPGENEFGVGYFDIGDPSMVTALSVQSGTIVWGVSPFAPPTWPDATPLIVPGCQSSAYFIVGCAADVNGDGTVNVLDLLAILAAWGNPGGPEDVNGDGIVNVLDLLAVLAAWGPCA